MTAAKKPNEQYRLNKIHSLMGWHTEKNKFSAISVPVLVGRAAVRPP